MTIKTPYPVPQSMQTSTHIQHAEYQRMYQQSIEQPDEFWAQQAHQFIEWFTPWQQVQSCDFKAADIKWFIGGKLNVSYNCIDKHLAEKGDKTAIIWEGNDANISQTISYKKLHELVCRFANVLKDRGVKKGDRVSIYMPMVPEAAIAMLACTRIGAVHSVVFGGFSSEALKDRILDSDCQVVITADQGKRANKLVPLKQNVDAAIVECPNIHTVVVVKITGNDIPWNKEKDIWYAESIKTADTDCPPEIMDAEDPLFILYTSGSTGKPKGVLHTTGGYLLYTAITHKYIFDYHDQDIYWCTADVGWVTGHSYVVYGPLCNGATTLMFEGVPNYPDPGRFWQIIDKHQVNIFYTAPTAIRSLMGAGDDFVTKHSRKSLRILGTVGEPINPEAWSWYHQVVGDSRCPIMDTWWQTETGGILITPLPGATALKPGSATQPFFGIEPAIVDEQGQELAAESAGHLTIKRSWPGQMRTVYGDHQRFIDTYFKAYPGKYFSGDGAKCDADGYYWITGRVDDVLNVSGHRFGTAEIESALVLHPSVAEAAVVGYPHDIKGQGIYAYITLMSDVAETEELRTQLKQQIIKEIGPIATPDILQYAPQLPKTRSGKIMRRILRKIAANELDNLGDTSTLADPSVVQQIIENRINQ